ncbi:MAG: (2Fe-2S)-binding protein [Deltaproteobacteria bacterium]|nr:(2Fe-2S)-binding protein [Deltaproteobacteria bacterium]
METRTLLYLLKGKFLKELSPNETYYFCSVPDCDVVYYSADSKIFKKDQVRVPVGQKEKENPQVCYCFHFFESDLKDEIETTGKTTIPDFIRQKVKEEACACEIMNPQGSCCLGNVSQAVKRIEKVRT